MTKCSARRKTITYILFDIDTNTKVSEINLLFEAHIIVYHSGIINNPFQVESFIPRIQDIIRN